MMHPREITQAEQSAGGPILITGGAGFIGSNLADALLSDGAAVIVFDNLSRPGVRSNVDWLRARHGDRLTLQSGDMRDPTAVAAVVNAAVAAVHLAGQVAVTESIVEPRVDFAVNAVGTVNLLEALRRKDTPTPLVFASTNKVYGSLAGRERGACDDRHRPADADLRDHGLDERQPLQFCTPYGCSKGSADQYVLDYARTFGLPAAVLRMSCIYGPRQFGTEDQGWVAHFLIRALEGQPITLYGDGRQVRDILDVSNAVEAYLAVWRRIDRVKGRAFNLGGGPANAVSLRQLLTHIAALLGRAVEVRLADWRAGDQRYFVADARAAEAALGLGPKLPWRRGVAALARWLAEERGLPLPAAAPAPRVERPIERLAS